MSAAKSAPQGRPRGRPKSYDPHVALTRATDIFWAKGYSATSVRDLLRATKLVPKSLYGEFGDKEALFIAAVGLYIEQHKLRYDQLRTEPLGLHRIRSYYEGFGDAPDRRGCLLVNSLGERGSVPQKAAERISDFFNWLEALYRHNLEAAAAQGALCHDANTESLAAALVVFDQGLAIASRIPGRARDLANQALSLLACLTRGAPR